MEFRALAETVEAGVGHCFADFGKRFFLQAKIIAEQVVQGFWSGKIGGVFEKLRADFFRQSDNFKEVAVAVAGERRDAHAGKNFAQSSVNGGANFHHAAGLRSFGKLFHQMGNDGAGTGGNQQRDVMRVEGLRGFDDQRHIPKTIAHHGLP